MSHISSALEDYQQILLDMKDGEHPFDGDVNERLDQAAYATEERAAMMDLLERLVDGGYTEMDQVPPALKNIIYAAEYVLGRIKKP